MLRSDWIHFVFLNRIFCCIGSAFRRIGSPFHMTGMGVADWVESWLPKTALAVAVLSLLKPMDTTESEQQESASKFYYPTKL